MTLKLKILKNKQDTFCPNPFTQLQIGGVPSKCGPCPYIHNTWNLNGTIKEKWLSNDLTEFRRKKLNGERDPICINCYREEDAGKLSLRQRKLNWQKGSDPTGQKLKENIFSKFIASKTWEKFPRLITIDPGNTCNLACVMCSGHASSKWNSLLEKMPIVAGKPVLKNWSISDELYREIIDNSEYVQKIELFGGEPFYDKRVKYLLINKLIEKGTSKHITLYFNTNGTLYNKDLIQELESNFKKIEIRVSIDGIWDQFEYIRYGAKFTEVIENTKKYSKMKNGDVEIICTVTPYNFLYLEEYDQFFAEHNWPVFYNLTKFPNEMLLFNIPEEVKPINLAKKFADIQKYINNKTCDLNAWYKFIRYTRLIDKHRKLSVKTVFPRFYELVKTHGFED